MSASPAAVGHSVIVTRLRHAGCVFAEDEARLLVAAARSGTELAQMIDRRVAGFPLEHIVGWAEFCGLRIAVAPGVFVPRRRTEFLVHEAAGLVRQAQAPARKGGARPRAVIVDLCCGSGAIGTALAGVLDGAELYAVDIDPAAVECARLNLRAAGGEAMLGDLYEPLPVSLRGRVDLLVANAPYVPSAEIVMMPPEARIHEAQVALDGGPDGLDVQRRVIADASAWLAPGGHLLVETSQRQAPESLAALTRAGLLPRVASSAATAATIVIGTMPHVAHPPSEENAAGS